MILYIDTTENSSMLVSLKESDGSVIASKKLQTDYDQAEKLLPSIFKLLASRKIDLKEITMIKAADYGGSFTSLRIGIVTANTLGYALGVPVEGERGGARKFSGTSIVEPVYDREPNITVKKAK